jgi:hypothetical protein
MMMNESGDTGSLPACRSQAGNPVRGTKALHYMQGFFRNDDE